MIGPFFVTTKYSLPVKELAKKNTLLAHTLLTYNKLLGHECMRVLGATNFSLLICKMFSHVGIWKTWFLLVVIVTTHLKSLYILILLGYISCKERK